MFYYCKKPPFLSFGARTPPGGSHRHRLAGVSHRTFLTKPDRTSTSQNFRTHQNWNSRRLVPGLAFGVKCVWAVCMLRAKTVHRGNGKIFFFYKSRPILIECAIPFLETLNFTRGHQFNKNGSCPIRPFKKLMKTTGSVHVLS